MFSHFPSEVALSVSSFLLNDILHTWVMPHRLTDISLLTRKKVLEVPALNILDFKVVVIRVIGAFLADERIEFTSYQYIEVLSTKSFQAK